MEFSFSTIDAFDEHIQNSIQGYNVLNEMIVNMAGYFLEDGSNYYDIGCSTGRLLNLINDKYTHKKVGLFGIEREYNFVKNLKNSDRISFLPIDISTGFGFNNACLITSIFTMQFIHPKHRTKILNDIYQALIPGGALIIAEKIFSESPRIQDMMTSLHYDYKKRAFSVEQIFEKESDLRAIMRPQTLISLKGMIANAGFEETDVFWRNFNFIALVCIKCH